MMRDYDRILHILGAIDDALESTDGITKEAFLGSKDKRAAATPACDCREGAFCLA